VDIRVSVGAEPRTIPELRGAPREDAEAELNELGMAVTVEEKFSDDVDAGLVLGTDPPAGEQVERGGPVTLIVSKGQDLVLVPDVVGMTYSDAYDVLSAAGFDPVPEGRGNNVVGTKPGPGNRVKRGSEIIVQLRR
jgi:serine/threonine-protein kinase